MPTRLTINRRYSAILQGVDSKESGVNNTVVTLPTTTGQPTHASFVISILVMSWVCLPITQDGKQDTRL
jgi:hypothetical protein